MDDNGQLSLFRIDVGQSRAMCTTDRKWLVWPQALGITPTTNAHCTITTDRPMPTTL